MSYRTIAREYLKMENWKDFPRAPESGVALAASSDLPQGHSISVDIDGFPVLLVRTDAGLFAYVNACPHQFLPLDYRADNILSTDWQTIRCSNHEAGFDLATGKGLHGHAIGCVLTPVPVREEKNQILIEG